MRKEIPWTLEGKSERKYTKSKESKHDTSFEMIRELFENNKNKTYTSAQIAQKVKRQAPMVSIVISQLRKNNEIKVVKLREEGYSITPYYQHAEGKDKEIEILNLTECKEFTTLPEFIKDYGIGSGIKFRYAVKAKSINKFLVRPKTTGNICYGYKKKDLEEILNELNNPKKGIQFKLFKWTITIE